MASGKRQAEQSLRYAEKYAFADSLRMMMIERARGLGNGVFTAAADGSDQQQG